MILSNTVSDEVRLLISSSVVQLRFGLWLGGLGYCGRLIGLGVLCGVGGGWSVMLLVDLRLMMLLVCSGGRWSGVLGKCMLPCVR